MNGMSNSADEVVECPLCMEPLEVDDLNFYPCTCGYQICRFCWHRIRTDENELCPACRKAYPENPADFTPLTQEEMIAFKSQKRQRDQQRKQKITENRKHLANVRVVQKNLVFVVGLPPRLADADILKKHEYFGKYGKIHKVVINPSTTYAGVQGPSASAYVTYVNNSDALRAIQSVNNINIDGRPIKTSLGTTKYCSHFMKNQQCPKNDCMYLHELGDPEASFTKEEMHQGKHQEYEKRLHDALLACSGSGPCAGSSIGTCKIAEPGKASNGSSSAVALSTMSSSSSSSSSSYTTSIANSSSSVAVPAQQRDAWPSLSVSPVNNKESAIINAKAKKDKGKSHDKLKIEKSAKAKNKILVTNNRNGFSTGTKENLHLTKDASSVLESPLAEQGQTVSESKLKTNRSKIEKIFTNRNSQEINQENQTFNADDEVKSIDDIENLALNSTDERKSNKMNNNAVFSGNGNEVILNKDNKNDCQRSLSSSSSSSSTASSQDNSSISVDSNKKNNADNTSGKNSSISNSSVDQKVMPNHSAKPTNIENGIVGHVSNSVANPNSVFENKNDKILVESLSAMNDTAPRSVGAGSEGNAAATDPTAALSNLNLFDDHNSFFSTSMASLHQSLLLKNKLEAEMRQNHVNSVVSSQLPDLLSGIDGFQSNVANSDEWDRTFKNVMMMRNNKQLEDQHQQLNHPQQQIHPLQQEEFLRFQELQKRNGLNNIGLSQMNGVHNDFGSISSNAFENSDVNRLSQVTFLQQQQILQQQQLHQPNHSEHILGNNLFGTNMSKFFDFHKNQQQQQIQQQFMLNGGSIGNANNAPFNDHLRLNSLLENNRINSQSNSLLATQQQLQKQRLKYESPAITIPNLQQQQSVQPNQHNQQTQQQPQQSRIANQFSQNSCVDDDLGFDPFIETQKGLAELMENETVQQQNANPPTGNNSTTATKPLHHQQQQIIDNMQRARMPPPGFNHMNAFGFGVVPRASQATSKILPFMNGGNQPPNAASMPSTNWNSHLNAFQQQPQPQPLNDAQMPQLNQNQGIGNHKAYGNNDWTSMDPAILSFRQFSFPQQPHLPHPQQQADFYLQNMAQQNAQQGFGGGSQPQLHCGGLTLPNGLMNTQQNSPAQVNANVQGMLEYLKNRQFI